MATVDFTLADLRTAVREEIGDTVPRIVQETVPGIVGGIINTTVPNLISSAIKETVPGIVTEIIQDTVPDIVYDIVHQEILYEREYTRRMINEASDGVLDEVVKVRKMLEEDALAESKRLTKVEKRLGKTTRVLASHVANPSAHGGQIVAI